MRGSRGTITLNAHCYRLDCSPEHGATLLAATWQHENGNTVALLEPLHAPQDGFTAGSFIMAPFANRIADGRFSFGSRNYFMPVNRPAAGMSIHGFSRDHAWKVISLTPEHAQFRDTVASPDHPWCYTLTLDLKIERTGVTVALSLRNDGDGALPFGIGFHPFFPCRPQSTLTFAAEGTYAGDERGLPAAPFSPSVGIGTGGPAGLDDWRGLDLCFRNWNPRRARIDWPTENCRLTVSASGALRHLHVYVPPDRDVFCIEPVSHFPDVVNRGILGTDAQMEPLLPGESFTGSMLLNGAPLSKVGAGAAIAV
ncbi:hypothetical protein [Rhizobium bangladeshense]|uniref:aldose epimerase family protein n=1 Tax=Rhizobium bangladeshense TaxID=1138189 RepID=UPI0007E5B465|nr:hypothetical protein [Rhizobium bangladeshense]